MKTRLPENPHDKDSLYGEITSIYIEETIEEDLCALDREIEIYGLKMPERVTKKIAQKYSLNINRKFSETKIAACIILIFVAVVGTVVANPLVVTAFKNKLRDITFTETNESVEITLEVSNPDFVIDIPQDFSLVNTIKNTNIEKYHYENTAVESDYFTVNFLWEDFTLIFDNEENDIIKEISINGQTGKLYVKNGVTKLVFTLNGRMIWIESNLPQEDVETLAQSIKSN